MAAPGLSFRSLYKDDLPIRVVDACLHVIAAYALPGPFWLQWLPDVLTVPMWLHGIVTDRFLPENSPVVRLHKLSHTLWVPMALLVAHDAGIIPEAVFLHWTVHVLLIDLCTHHRWERARH